MNRIPIANDYYDVKSIHIVPFCTHENQNFLLLNQDSNGILQEFSYTVKKNECFRKAFATLLQRLYSVEIIPTLVSPPLKKIIKSSQKSVCLVWVVAIDPRFFSKSLRSARKVSISDFQDTSNLNSSIFDMKNKIVNLIEDKSQPF
jgi:hypothetical protein